MTGVQTCALPIWIVMPYGPPSEPSVSCFAQGGSVTCTWTAGATGGRPTTYQGDTLHNEHAPQVEASGTRSFSPGAGNKVTWCVRARNDAGQTSDWECSSATAALQPEIIRTYE